MHPSYHQLRARLFDIKGTKTCYTHGISHGGTFFGWLSSNTYAENAKKLPIFMASILFSVPRRIKANDYISLFFVLFFLKHFYYTE